MKPGEVVHLGDGAYVQYDGYGFALMANSHEHPTDTVYIDGPVCGKVLARLILDTVGEST